MQLWPGPQIDGIHLASLRAALFTGGERELVEPGEPEDFGPARKLDVVGRGLVQRTPRRSWASATTQTPWSAWACRSVTPDRSGSCRTADEFASTVEHEQSRQITADRAPLPTSRARGLRSK